MHRFEQRQSRALVLDAAFGAAVRCVGVWRGPDGVVHLIVGEDAALLAAAATRLYTPGGSPS